MILHYWEFYGFFSCHHNPSWILFIFYLGYILIRNYKRTRCKNRPKIQYCSYCGNEIQSAFVCEYCKLKFCRNHRHPIIHECQKIPEDLPLYETCSVCGEHTYLPYRCQYCKKIFCGDHHLPFSHNCEKIDDWKDSAIIFGVTTVSKDGKIVVKK